MRRLLDISPLFSISVALIFWALLVLIMVSQRLHH